MHNRTCNFDVLSPTAAVNVTLEQAQYMVNEADGYVEVCAVLVGGTVERRVIVSLSTSNVDAVGKLYIILYPKSARIVQLHGGCQVL